MKKIIYLLLLFPILVNAQIKLAGKVIDAKTKEAISYVNIENFRAQTGTQANQDGVFDLNMPKGKQRDTLKISCVGYADRYVTNLQSNEAIIYELFPVVLQLNEVKVANKKPIEVEVGVIDNKGKNYKIFNQIMQKPGMQQAVYMANAIGKTSYLKCINFFMGKDMFEAPFRVRVYENDNGLPGKDLLNKSIEFKATKRNSWNELNMADYFFEVPENGFFVAVEWIANDQYKKDFNLGYRMADGTTENRIKNYYGPEIIQKFDSNLGLTYKRVLGCPWIKDKGGVGINEKYRSVAIDLLVKATLSVYK